MTLLLNYEEVDRALTHEDALSATEAIILELANGQAIDPANADVHAGGVESSPRLQLPLQVPRGVGSGVWALRINVAQQATTPALGSNSPRLGPRY